jgi:hypothetical protein
MLVHIVFLVKMGLEIMHLLLPNSKENPLNKVMQIIGETRNYGI